MDRKIASMRGRRCQEEEEEEQVDCKFPRKCSVQPMRGVWDQNSNTANRHLQACVRAVWSMAGTTPKGQRKNSSDNGSPDGCEQQDGGGLK